MWEPVVDIWKCPVCGQHGHWLVDGQPRGGEYGDSTGGIYSMTLLAGVGVIPCTMGTRLKAKAIDAFPGRDEVEPRVRQAVSRINVARLRGELALDEPGCLLERFAQAA